MKVQMIRYLTLMIPIVLTRCTTTVVDDGRVRPDPILFIPGIGGTSASFTEMKARFIADGWLDSELFFYNPDPTKSNVTHANDIQAIVNQMIAVTGATKVDIVGHSMGSLSARYYLKNLGGTDKVEAFASLGGPNHGTTTATPANGCNVTPCAEMLPGSGFLTALNATDETPGTVRYATWRTPCDTQVIPVTSVNLDGATNNETACLDHNALRTDVTVYASVRDFIN